ncbi:hypothetical protein MUK42_37798 [Musa troglodytarum]|uniref:Uncharacterized protein n=1 Tax=Musa troglodytarum TaxID=320322 RepID=A0A9E7EJ39_9LILI|nr:hypothetical protein MUK42_37798 [Musa troglodytarum]
MNGTFLRDALASERLDHPGEVHGSVPTRRPKRATWGPTQQWRCSLHAHARVHLRLLPLLLVNGALVASCSKFSSPLLRFFYSRTSLSISSAFAGGTDSPGSLPECGQPSGPLLPPQGGGEKVSLMICGMSESLWGGKGVVGNTVNFWWSYSCTKMMAIRATTMCSCNKTPDSLVLLILLVNMN